MTDKETMAIIKQMVADGQISQEVAEKYFPELKEKESEDEKIRKHLINYFKHKMDDTLEYWEGIAKEDALAWLEKQGEQKPVVDTKVIIPKFRVGDIVKSKSRPTDSPRKIISIGKDCYWCEDRGCIGFAWEDDCEIVEQKPAAWSEEDEKTIHLACEFIRHRSESNGSIGGINYSELINRLRSIIPQNRWKPTEKEMEAISIAVHDSHNRSYHTELYRLKLDLKKLTE